MKNRNLIKNFSYLVFISILLISGIILLANHKLQAQRTFDYNLIYITFVTIVCFGGIGVLLGLSNRNHFSFKKIKILKIDKVKLLLLGLPSFILSMTYIWGYLGLFNKSTFIASYMSEFDTVIIISSIILGHTIISSIDME